MRSTRSLLTVVLAILVAVPRVSAQVHVAGQQALDAAVQQHVSATHQDRGTVRLFLHRSEVRAIAGKYGMDIRRAERAGATMKSTDPAPGAAQARQAYAARSTGQTRG